MSHILEIQGLEKNYSKSNFQLKDFSLTLPYGAILGVIGENGAGKTTLLNMIVDIKKKDAGVIKLFGSELTKSETTDNEIRKKIGVVFDMNTFPTKINAKKISKIYGAIYDTWDEDYYFELLERFKIERQKPLKDYSKGMLMTVSILTVLAYRPQLLILDEATSGLDPVRREEMLELFLEFVESEKNSIIFSSHITTDIERIADYVTFIEEGTTVLSAEKDALIYEYGVVRCGKEQLEQLEKKHVIKVLKRDYEYSVLVTNQRPYLDQFIVDNPTLAEVIYIISKGESL